MLVQYWQRGESLDYKNETEEKISVGDVVLLGTHLGVAGCHIPVGQTGSLHVEGVFIFPKAEGELAVGADVAWNEETQKMEEATEAVHGYVVESAGGSSPCVKVRIG